jgi:hypothetical protein
LLTYSFDNVNKKVEQIAIQKKLEIRDELASKADLAVLEHKLDKKITIWSIVIIAVVIITNQSSIHLFAQLLGLIK